jgi:small-conductance mechanosensitive channel
MSSQDLSNLLGLLWANKFVHILLYFLFARLLSLISHKIATRLMNKDEEKQSRRQSNIKRQNTIQSLIASAISLVAFLTAALLSVGLFVKTDTLVWMVGLFSAAFGLGARPLISDYLSGIGFIFEDTFSVGEKVEIQGVTPVEGVIEAISLRTTLLRAKSGELFVVPNGEIRMIRNFSRGKFSLATIKLKINSDDLSKALDQLEELGSEAVELLPNLLEQWMLLSETGVIGHETELTVIAKAKFGMASEMRPRLLTLIQERFGEENIPLVS